MQARLNRGMQDSLANRLKYARKARGWTQEKLSAESGVKQSDISKIERGDTLRPTGLLALATALRCNPYWLETGDGVWDAAVSLVPSNLSMAGIIRRKDHTVPVVGMARLGDNGYYEEVSDIPGVGDGVLEAYSDDEAAYALRVRGDSMFPAIRDGWYVVIEPQTRPTPGEYVLVKLKSGQKMVKELVIQKADSITVMSVNGDKRRTIMFDEIDDHMGIQPVAAILSPSKWRPE